MAIRLSFRITKKTVSKGEREMPSPTYFRKKNDPIYMRRIGDPHIVMYNPHLADRSDYVSGWTFEDLLPRGTSRGDLRPQQIIRPPALGGANLGVLREQRAEKATIEDAAKRQETILKREKELMEHREEQAEEVGVPTKEEKVPDESPENWRNWSKRKLLNHAQEVVGIKIHHSTNRENVIKKIEEALHYVEEEK